MYIYIYIYINKHMYICVYVHIYVNIQSWMTIKKTEISAQHEFLKPKFLCVLYACIELLYSYI